MNNNEYTTNGWGTLLLTDPNGDTEPPFEKPNTNNEIVCKWNNLKLGIKWNVFENNTYELGCASNMWEFRGMYLNIYLFSGGSAV